MIRCAHLKSHRNMFEILVATRSQLSCVCSKRNQVSGDQTDFTKLYSVLDLNQHASFHYWEDSAQFPSEFSNKDSKKKVFILLEGNWKTWGTREELKHYFTTLIFFSRQVFFIQCIQDGGEYRMGLKLSTCIADKKICKWNAVLRTRGYQEVHLPWTPLRFCPAKSLNLLQERKKEIATSSFCFCFYPCHQARREHWA